MVSLTLVILNVFEANTVSRLRTTLCGSPRQSAVANRASEMSEMLLEIGSSRPAVFCKNEIL